MPQVGPDGRDLPPAAWLQGALRHSVAATARLAITRIRCAR